MIIYNVSLILFLTISFLGVSQSNVAKYVVILYLLIVFFIIFGFRWYVGNDYEGYLGLHNSIQNGIQLRNEPLFQLFFSFFSGPNGSVYAIAFLTTLSFSIYIIACHKYSSVVWIVYFYFVCTMVLFFNDQIRQATALSIFIFAYRYIESRSLLKFCLCMIVAFMFHYYSLVLFLSYFFKGSIIKKNFYIYILFVLILLYFLGFFRTIQDSLFSILPVFVSSIYAGKDYLFEVHRSSGLTIVVWAVPFMLLCVQERNSRDLDHLILLCFIGLCSKIVFFDFHLLSRLSNYYLYLSPLLYAIALSRNSTGYKYKVFYVFWFFIYFQYLIYIEGGYHGGFPYKNYLLL
ncbi:EpsG family [Pseudoalteromonas carrageenovora]|uniref:EpsG family protein n=1 Tax=Pseudoalteromonas carrageenovora IAM 12662 TaxID=1314868 RepID=A0ABR9EN32_PSEVC|nr:hypothetical protein [Pseudoalteromonas carrageenovora IAM 12662]QBJ70695.1 EpsG family [Pseudoalteromonas carrageenovora]